MESTPEERARTDKALKGYMVFLVALTFLFAGIIVGNTFPMHSAADDVPEPDWTVASCEEWADTADPVLPAYTRTDVCAVRTASGAWYMSSPDNPSPLDAPVTH